MDWLIKIIFPIIVPVLYFTIAINILLLPLLLFKKSYGFYSIFTYVSSFVFGITAWILSFFLTYLSFGTTGLIIGFIFLGVGVVPLAILGSIINSDWILLVYVITLLFFCYGTRFLSSIVADRYDDYLYEKELSKKGNWLEQLYEYDDYNIIEKTKNEERKKY